MMCDGLGVFSDLDFKRALLLYDSILYLLPEHTVRFPGITGKRQSLLYPLSLYERQEFTVHHFTPPSDLQPLVTAAARADVTDSAYAGIVDQLSDAERVYTWSVVNSDGDLGGGESLALPPDQAPLAQAILLNKFLLAADAADCVPIAGRQYVDQLLHAKYRLATTGLDALAQATGAPLSATEDARHFAVARAIVARLVPDAELEKRSFEDIRVFKAENHDLFERFSVRIRHFARDVSEMPATREFDRKLADLLATDVWEEEKELESLLRSRWEHMFRTVVDEGVKADSFRPTVRKVLTALAVGVLPTLTLGPLSVASAIAGMTAAAPWLVQATLDYVGKRREIRRHGLYYLHAFARG
jgi:hypothetical protein